MLMFLAIYTNSNLVPIHPTKNSKKRLWSVSIYYTTTKHCRGYYTEMKTRKVYFPKKYYANLSTAKKTQRKREIRKFGSLSWRNPKAYVGFKTDRGVSTKKSGYTVRWYRKFPNAKSLEEKSKATGVPLSYIKESYNRGMAAWRTGHRPGATQQQWGYARVHSFLLCGKTFETTDSDLAERAKRESRSARKWWSRC